MHAIDFSPLKYGEVISQIGGGAFVPEDFSWPLDVLGNPMLPLLTIRQDLFLIPTLPNDLCVTVFICYGPQTNTINAFRECAKNDEAQSPVGIKVILHTDSMVEKFLPNKEHYPKFYMKTRKFSDVEQKEDLEDEINGIYISKIFGRPSWVQDEIYLGPKYSFDIQITENDLVKLNGKYDGIFNDGSIYIYLLKSLRKLNPNAIAGEGFIQFT